jgi:hypothetical protein
MKFKMASFDFLPEHWNIIKSYAGIYHLRRDWDLMKLDNRVICLILAMVSPKYIYNMKFTSNEQRIKCIWKYLHKKKLYDVNHLINQLIYKTTKNINTIE